MEGPAQQDPRRTRHPSSFKMCPSRRRQGELRIAVKACGVNFPDSLIIEDKYQLKPPRPFAPGGEIAGIVDAVGEGVDPGLVGKRMIGFIGHGGMAEKVCSTRAAPHRCPTRCRSRPPPPSS